MWYSVGLIPRDTPGYCTENAKTFVTVQASTLGMELAAWKPTENYKQQHEGGEGLYKICFIVDMSLPNIYFFKYKHEIKEQDK